MSQAERPPADRNCPPAPAPGRGWRLVVFAVLVVLAACVLLQAGLGINWPVWLRAPLAGPWRGRWHFPGESLRALIAGSAVLLASFGQGWLLIGLIDRRRGLAWIERAAWAIPAGTLPLSLVTLAAGLAGFASPLQMQVLLGLLLVAAVPGLRMALRERRAPGAPWPGGAGLVAAPVLLGALLLALAPETQSDALRYHLAAPAAWLRDGRIHYLPWQAFSNFPFLGEMLFMQALAAGGTSAARVVHCGMLAPVMLLTALITRRWLGLIEPRSGAGARRRLAGWSATAFLCIPSVPILAGWSFVDGFMTAGFLGFVHAGALGLARRRAPAGWLIGLAGAMAVSVKYSMLPLLGLLGIGWLAIAWRAGGARRAWRAALIAAVVATLFAAPWFVRNAAWTGNPFYPLAWGTFGGGEWSEANADFYREKAGEKGFRLAAAEPALATLPRPAARAVELLLSPVTTMLYPHLFEGHFPGALPLLALLAALGWAIAGWIPRRAGDTPAVVRMRRAGRAWLILALAGSWVFWFLTYQSTRLLIPTLALLLAAGAVALDRWRGCAGAAAGLTLRAIAFAGMLHGLAVFTTLALVPDGSGASNADGLATALGFQRRDAYLARSVDYWRAARWLGARLAPGEGALLIGEHRTLYFDFPVVASDWFDTPQPVPLIEATADNDALLDALLARGVTHIFYNAGELAKFYGGYFVPRVGGEPLARLRGLLPLPDGSGTLHPRLEQVFGQGDRQSEVIIYRIRPRSIVGTIREGSAS